VTAPVDVTSGYRDRLLTHRVVIGQSVSAGLADVDLDLAPERLRQAIVRWATAAAALTAAGQAMAAQLTATYLAAYLSLTDAQPPPPVDLNSRVGRVPDDVPGSSLEDALMRAGVAVLWRLRSAPRADAVRYGQYAASRVTWTSVQDSATSVLDEVIDVHAEIVGWRRIASATACKRCVQAAERTYRSTEPLRRRHPSCRCSQEPIVRR